MEESIDVSAFRDRLLARERALIAEESGEEDAASAVELDQARVGRLSRMDAIQAHQMAKATSRRRHLERGRIAAALKRIDDGEYGSCLTCGDSIPAPRLEIDPAASQCVGCAANAEAERL